MALGDGLTITDLAYAAALVDGEGCVSIKRSKGIRQKRGSVSPEYRVYVLVANSHLGVLQYMQNKFGGSLGIQSKDHICKNGSMAKTIYRWRLASRSAVNFIKLIIPYMIVKKDQAEICLMFQDSVFKSKGQALPEDILNFREECFQKTRSLNKKGAF